MATIVITGDHGYTLYKPNLADGTIVDASGATFLVDNNVADDGKALETAVSIRDAANIRIFGGTVFGKVSQTADWRAIYQYKPGNSPALYARDAPGVHFDGWRIDKAWDAIRTSYNSDGFLVENAWITNCRDDVFENDKLNSGTIRNCLFDGNFGGISLDPSSGSTYNGTGKVVTIDGVLIRMKSYLVEGKQGHTSPLKLDVRIPMPALHIKNSVIAIEKVDSSHERLARAWAYLAESSGNVFLNLSDVPLPAKYPKPPADWRVLQGQPARDYWTKVRDEWVVKHADMAIAGDYVPETDPDPDPEPEIDMEQLAALQVAVNALVARVAALEARPADTTIVTRLGAAETAVVELRAFMLDVRTPG